MTNKLHPSITRNGKRSKYEPHQGAQETWRRRWRLHLAMLRQKYANLAAKAA